MIGNQNKVLGKKVSLALKVSARVRWLDRSEESQCKRLNESKVAVTYAGQGDYTKVSRRAVV
jgi:hypothetical protein